MSALEEGDPTQLGTGAPGDSHIAFSQASSPHHVDVAQAEEQFHALSRQLTVRSEIGQSNSKLSESTAAGNDIEKGDAGEQGEGFNLLEYLTSSNDANQRAGIKHKVATNSIPILCRNHVLIFDFLHRYRTLESSGRTCRWTLREAWIARYR